MGKREDLIEFDKSQIVRARRLGQSISKTAALVGCSRSAVISIYQKWSKEGTVVNQRQGHGRPRLIDAGGERRLARVAQSNRRATGAQIAQEMRALIESKGPSIYKDYEASGMLSETSRKLLVKIGVSALVEQSGFYPCNEEKRMLAESMVTLFPSLKIKMGEENEGFEHFYDPVSHSGFIEMRLRNLRRKLHDDQRRYQSKRSRISDSSGVSITLELTAEGEEESIGSGRL
ncbi:hypothetical protein DPX16_10481 [Anabarilius grahami]|uniref:Uncharacterized protein n=1 Tax=Anabarilius grahami TaxID=495550 RepID=A0A3N0Z7Y3_ANAGA|nr:hypothetical protein DPX16_10481 [Anabarilius grahami]